MRSPLVALALAASVAQGYEVKRDSSGAIATWKAPLHFVIDADLDEKLEAANATGAVQAALRTVGAAVPSLVLDGSAGKAHGVGYDFDHPSQSTSDVVVPEEWKWDVDAVAITVVSISRTTHQIIEADIAFNAKHTAFAVVGASPETGRYDVQNAMTHELGHALGLAHNPAKPDCLMYPHSTPGEVSKRALAADDREGLSFLYTAVVMPAVDPGAKGCSSTGTAPFALLAAGLLVTLRRRRAVAVLASLLGVLVFVAPAFAAQAQAGWKVAAVHTLAPGAGPAVLESEVTLLRDGVYTTVRMPGGRFGDVEQIVEGVSVPVEGELVVLP